MLFPAIAAIMPGGASLIGGTFVAALPLAALKNPFIPLGIGSSYRMGATGVILVPALVLDKFIDYRALRA